MAALPDRAARLICASLLFACAPSATSAQRQPAGDPAARDTPAYPTRTVRIIVPSPAGANADLLARITGSKLSESLGRQVAIDNRPGANIAPQLAAKSASDGYTLYQMDVSSTIAVSLHRKLAYDPLRDFTAVTELASMPFILVVQPALSVQSVAELVTLAKGRSGQLTYATGGSGMPSRLAMELFKAAAAVNIAPVASRDAGVTATESGDAMQVLFLPLGGALPQLKAGKLRALGAASARRVEVLPDLPTVAESGVPGFEASEWHGIVVPRGTERDIIARLYTEYIDILNLSDVRDPLLAQGFDIVANSPREFAAHIRAEIAKWATAVQRSGLKPD